MKPIELPWGFTYCRGLNNYQYYWCHILNILARVSYTSNIPQNDVANDLGPGVGPLWEPQGEAALPGVQGAAQLFSDREGRCSVLGGSQHGGGKAPLRVEYIYIYIIYIQIYLHTHIYIYINIDIYTYVHAYI